MKEFLFSILGIIFISPKELREYRETREKGKALAICKKLLKSSRQEALEEDEAKKRIRVARFCGILAIMLVVFSVKAIVKHQLGWFGIIIRIIGLLCLLSAVTAGLRAKMVVNRHTYEDAAATSKNNNPGASHPEDRPEGRPESHPEGRRRIILADELSGTIRRRN